MPLKFYYTGVLICHSTLSSGLNGISANTLMDFVSPFYPAMSELRRTVLAKIIGTAHTPNFSNNIAGKEFGNLGP